MNDPALVRYLKTCCRRLNQQQASLIHDFSLRTCAAIEIQQATGLMTLNVPGRGQAIATVTPIARYRPDSQDWHWAWAAPDAFPLHHSTKVLQSLAAKTGLELFASAQLKLELEQVSLLVAMACSQLKASGCYRWRDGDEYVLWAINHLAFATVELESSGSGDRLQLSQRNETSVTEQTQGGQLVRLSPTVSGPLNPAALGSNQRIVEGLSIHSLCSGSLMDAEATLADLRALTD